jgi:hypothetical protein
LSCGTPHTARKALHWLRKHFPERSQTFTVTTPGELE